MDGTTFDDLIKRLVSKRLTRSDALRGLVASGAALAGVTLTAEPGAAHGKRKICHCTNETAASCNTKNIGKKAARKHLQRHDCDYGRECDGPSGCCHVNTQACTSDALCCSGFCGDGTCRPADCANVTESCATLSCCSGNCQGGTCFACKSATTPCIQNSECCSLTCSGGTCA